MNSMVSHQLVMTWLSMTFSMRMFLRRQSHFTLLALIACFSILLTTAYAWNGVRVSGADAALTLSCVDEGLHGADASSTDCSAENHAPGVDDVLEGLSLTLAVHASNDTAHSPFVALWRNATIARPSPPPDV
ncbi:hypothetical protein [Dyella subtropica]|uniref:hypothetical protein n=1 Tax=Dyella subtropica TaxID=2992127 RepID=UPI0022520102|nr:hypothetical protein [Dyella subtropica]